MLGWPESATAFLSFRPVSPIRTSGTLSQLNLRAVPLSAIVKFGPRVKRHSDSVENAKELGHPYGKGSSHDSPIAFCNGYENNARRRPVLVLSGSVHGQD